VKKKVMLKGKLLRVSILLIALFTATIYLVTNSRVNSLMDKSIKTKVDNISDMGLYIISSKYVGSWKIKSGKLLIGDNQVDNSFNVLDEIKEKTGAHVSIYLADEKVATSERNAKGERTLGERAPNEVVESVLRKGTNYEGTENIFGEKYAVKYMPIRDNSGKIIGMWSVAVPNSAIGNQRMQIIAMRASIVVISILCGIIGCIILMFYAKKFLTDIDTLKVSFLETNKSSNKTQQRVISLSLVLIFTFFIIWFTIQGFTIGNVVNNLENGNIKDRLDVNSKLGLMLFDEIYKGDWSIKDDKLYKGKVCLNDNDVVLNRINYNDNYFSTVFMGDISVSTNSSSYDSTKTIGTKAPSEIVDTVLKRGEEYVGEIDIAGKKYMAKYIPLKDASGKVIGMWNLGVEKKVVAKQIRNIRKNITQISLLAIIVAFSTFVYLSVRMVSDIKNYKVSLQNNIN